VVTLTPKTGQAERKAIDKEMRVHAALKHGNVLEFLTAVIVEPGTESPYIPAIYMLLEFAAGGDLFDKIGAPALDLSWQDTDRLIYQIAPDVGVLEEVAHFYFLQLLSGLVTFNCHSRRTARRMLTFPRKCQSELHSRRGRVSPGSQARKPSPRCRRDTQDIRFRPLFGIQA
jgi:serine/threonine protein kinase